jgi:TatD DNase family protein
MKIFESHAHLDFEHFDKDREELLQKCKKLGIERIINVGVDKKTVSASLKLAEKYDMIYATVGFHPHDAKVYNREFLLASAKNKNVVAIGECGLDYYRDLSPRDVQRKVFTDQIKIAIDLNLPLVVHDRDAHDECFELLQEQNPANVVFHCFSGDELFAEKVLSMGWKISFTGTITYKNNLLENVVRMVPDDMFFIETDSPYLTPVPNRGKRNSPLNLRYVIEKISEIKGITPNKVAELSYNNAMNFFF